MCHVGTLPGDGEGDRDGVACHQHTQSADMSRLHLLWPMLVCLLACGGSKQRPAAAPQPAPRGGGAHLCIGCPIPADAIDGTTGALNGKEYWLSTSARVLPPVGATGEVKWKLDRKHGPFGRGVIMGLGQVRVKQVQPGPPGMTQHILLEILGGHGGIRYNGTPVNVVTPGKRVKLILRR